MTEPFSDNNTITVLIPACHADRYFAELRDDLQKQTLKPAQIIVVDSELLQFCYKNRQQVSGKAKRMISFMGNKK